MNRSPSSKKEEIHSSNPSETTATNRKGYSRRLIADYTKQWGERERKHSQQAIATSWDVDLPLFQPDIYTNNRDWCGQTRRSYIPSGRNVIQREKVSHQARRNRCKQARHHWAGGSAWLYACGLLGDAMNLLYYLGYSLDFWPACIYKSIVWRAELPDTVNSIDIHHCSRRHTWNSLAAIRRMQQLEDSE